MPRRPEPGLLARVPLFEGLSRAHLGRVAVLAEEASYNASRVLVRKDDPGKAFYVIVEGTAKVVKGKIVTARREAEVGPGDFFGELALLDGEPRAATVVAARPLTAIRIERASFRRLLRRNPIWQSSSWRAWPDARGRSSTGRRCDPLRRYRRTRAPVAQRTERLPSN